MHIGTWREVVGFGIIQFRPRITRCQLKRIEANENGEMKDPSENRISPVLFPFIAADVKKNHGNDTYIRHERTRDPGARAFVLRIRPFSRSSLSCSEDHPTIREIDDSMLRYRVRWGERELKHERN